MFALFYCRTKAITVSQGWHEKKSYKSYKVGSLLLGLSSALGSGIKHYDTRIAIQSTSKKETVDTFCLRLLQNVGNGTFDIILRPHIARLFSIKLFDFHSILHQLLLSIKALLELVFETYRGVAKNRDVDELVMQNILCEANLP